MSPVLLGLRGAGRVRSWARCAAAAAGGAAAVLAGAAVGLTTSEREVRRYLRAITLNAVPLNAIVLVVATAAAAVTPAVLGTDWETA